MTPSVDRGNGIRLGGEVNDSRAVSPPGHRADGDVSGLATEFGVVHDPFSALDFLSRMLVNG